MRKKRRKKEERRKKKPQGKNIMSASATQGGHNNTGGKSQSAIGRVAASWRKGSMVTKSQERSSGLRRNTTGSIKRAIYLCSRLGAYRHEFTALWRHTRARDVEICAVFCGASPLRITQSCGEEIASLSTSSSPHFRVTRQTHTVASLRGQIKRSLSFSGSDTGGGWYFSTFIKVLFKKNN